MIQFDDHYLKAPRVLLRFGVASRQSQRMVGVMMVRSGDMDMADTEASRAAFGGRTVNDEDSCDYRNEKTYNRVFRHQFIPLPPLWHGNSAEMSHEVKAASEKPFQSQISLTITR